MSSVFCSYLFCQLTVMWMNSPVLLFHPSYGDAVYQADKTFGSVFVGALVFHVSKNMLWLISVRNNFLRTSGENRGKDFP